MFFQPLHRDVSSAPALLGLQSTCGGEALLEIVGDPVEELREAVEMLNDTARERGRSRSHDQAIRELLSKVQTRRQPHTECVRVMVLKGVGITSGLRLLDLIYPQVIADNIKHHFPT